MAAVDSSSQPGSSSLKRSRSERQSILDFRSVKPRTAKAGDASSEKAVKRRQAIHPARPPAPAEEVEFEDAEMSDAAKEQVSPSSTAVTAPSPEPKKQRPSSLPVKLADAAIPSTEPPTPVSTTRPVHGSPLKHSLGSPSSPQLQTPPASATTSAASPVASTSLAPALPIASPVKPATGGFMRGMFALVVDAATGMALVQPNTTTSYPSRPSLHAAQVDQIGRILASRDVLVNRFGVDRADELIRQGSQANANRYNGVPLPADDEAESVSVKACLAWCGPPVAADAEDEEDRTRDAWLTPPSRWAEDDLFGTKNAGLGLSGGKSVRTLAHRPPHMAPEDPAVKRRAHFAIPPTPDAADDFPRLQSRQRTPSSIWAHPTLVEDDLTSPHRADRLDGVALAPSPAMQQQSQWQTPGAGPWGAYSPRSPVRRQRFISSGASPWDYPGMHTPAVPHGEYHEGFSAPVDAQRRMSIDYSATPSRYGPYRPDAYGAPPSIEQPLPYGLATPGSTHIGYGRGSVSQPARTRTASAVFWHNLHDSVDSASPSSYLAPSAPKHQRQLSYGLPHMAPAPTVQGHVHFLDTPSPHAHVASNAPTPTSMVRSGSGLGIAYNQPEEGLHELLA